MLESRARRRMSHPPDLFLVLASIPWLTTTETSLSLGLLGARGAPAPSLRRHLPQSVFAALIAAGGYEFVSKTPATRLRRARVPDRHLRSRGTAVRRIHR